MLRKRKCLENGMWGYFSYGRKLGLCIHSSSLNQCFLFVWSILYLMLYVNSSECCFWKSLKFRSGRIGGKGFICVNYLIMKLLKSSNCGSIAQHEFSLRKFIHSNWLKEWKDQIMNFESQQLYSISHHSWAICGMFTKLGVHLRSPVWKVKILPARDPVILLLIDQMTRKYSFFNVSHLLCSFTYNAFCKKYVKTCIQSRKSVLLHPLHLIENEDQRGKRE